MNYYCFKCKKKLENKNPKVENTKTEEYCFYQTVQSVVVKNRDLLRSKKPVVFQLVYYGLNYLSKEFLCLVILFKDMKWIIIVSNVKRN